MHNWIAAKDGTFIFVQSYYMTNVQIVMSKICKKSLYMEIFTWKEQYVY